MLNRVANQSRVVKGVRLRSLVAAVLLLPAGLQSVSALTFAASPLQLSAGAITTELACRHLFIRLADGPKALSWNTRMAMLKNSSLSSAQIQMVIHAANAYAANTARLSREAQAMGRLAPSPAGRGPRAKSRQRRSRAGRGPGHRSRSTPSLARAAPHPPLPAWAAGRQPRRAARNRAERCLAAVET